MCAGIVQAKSFLFSPGCSEIFVMAIFMVLYPWAKCGRGQNVDVDETGLNGTKNQHVHNIDSCSLINMSINIQYFFLRMFSNKDNDLKKWLRLFSGTVAVGSKGGIMVPGAVWAVTIGVWAVAASM